MSNETKHLLAGILTGAGLMMLVVLVTVVTR